MAQSNWSAEDPNRGCSTSRMDRERQIAAAKRPARAARAAGRGKREV
jgi:hypothetical protein